MSSGRLLQLLRQFQLPPGATAADLRKAYFRQAKQLHPDRNRRSIASEEFAQLRADFDEAMQLLERRKTWTTSSSSHGASAGYGWQPGSEPPFPEGQKWSAANWAARSQAQEMPRGFRMSSSWSAEPQRPPPGVPVEGLPQDTVYTIVGALSAGLFLLGIWKFLTSENIGLRHRLGPDWLRADGRQQFSAATEGMHGSWDGGGAPRKLRSALEGSKAKEDPAAAVAHPFAAHHAAARDRVWWLERCGASPGCRPLLSSKDERGDTPLHHCARTGHSEACCALLRHHIEQTVNHFGLAPQQLAQQLGHKDIAVLLRSWSETQRGDASSVAARRKVARHSDGLGHLATAEDGLYFDFNATECLQQAVKMAGFEVDVPSEEPLRPLWLQSLFERRTTLDMAEGQGLLVYEQPGQVTPDAKGHWHALRRGKDCFYRLDPVRGCFALTSGEAAELLQRYAAYGLAPAETQKEGRFG